MQEKFEHKLTQRIHEVFESHEPEYNPQDWEAMQEKLGREKHHVVPVWWMIGRAAAIVLLVGLGSWFAWQQFNPGEPKITEVETISKSNQDEASAKARASVEQNQEVTAEKRPETVDQPNLETSERISLEESTSSVISGKNDKSIDLDQGSTDQPMFVKPVDTIPFTIAQLSADRMLNAEPIIILANESTDYVVDPEISIEKYKRENKLKLGFEVSSFTNYSSENLEAGMNFGAGMTANIPVVKNLSVSPGIIYSNQQLDYAYENTLTESSIVSTQSFLSAEEYIEANPELRPATVEFSALDIPVNLQYQFAQGKRSGYFVELGISSLLYLDENYTYTFVSQTSGGPFPYSGTNQSDPVSAEIEEDAFQTFDFARLINFSVGWDFILSKKLDMTLNPFLQYPTNTLTSGDIKFGTGGLKARIMLKPAGVQNK